MPPKPHRNRNSLRKRSAAAASSPPHRSPRQRPPTPCRLQTITQPKRWTRPNRRPRSRHRRCPLPLSPQPGRPSSFASTSPRTAHRRAGLRLAAGSAAVRCCPALPNGRSTPPPANRCISCSSSISLTCRPKPASACSRPKARWRCSSISIGARARRSACSMQSAMPAPRGTRWMCRRASPWPMAMKPRSSGPGRSPRPTARRSCPAGPSHRARLPCQRARPPAGRTAPKPRGTAIRRTGYRCRSPPPRSCTKRTARSAPCCTIPTPASTRPNAPPSSRPCARKRRPGSTMR